MATSTTFTLPPIYENENSWGPPTDDQKSFGFMPSVNVTKAWDKFAPRIVDSREERAAEVEKVRDNVKRGDGFREVENTAKADALAKAKSDAEGNVIPIRPMFWDPEIAARGRGGAQQGGGRGAARGGGRGVGRGGRGGFFYNNNANQIQPATFGPVIAQDRDVQVQLPWAGLAQSLGVGMPRAIDLKLTGKTRLYDAGFDKQFDKFPELKKASASNVSFARPRILEDLTIRDIVRDLSKDVTKTFPIIVASEKVLASIMASCNGRFIWDIEVMTKKRFVFLQERDDKKNAKHLFTEWVDENVVWGKSSPDPTSVNHIVKVGEESTQVNRNFSVASQTTAEYTHPGSVKNSFATDKSSYTMFRYRHFKCGQEGTDDYFEVICRCEIDAVLKVPGQKNVQFVKTFSLVDQLQDGSESGSAWKKTISTKGKGALLINEIKNNSFKIIRWISQSILAGASQMKIAFVTRANPASNHRHVVLGVETKEPVSLASQFQIKIDNLWSIVGDVLQGILSATGGKDTTGFYLVREIEYMAISTYIKNEDDDSDDDDEDDEDDTSSDDDDDSSSSSSDDDSDSSSSDDDSSSDSDSN